MALHSQGTMLMISLTLLILTGVARGNEENIDNQHDSTTKWLFRHLGQKPEVLHPLRAMVEQRLGRPLPDIEATYDTSGLCTGCRWAVDSLKTALATGLTYEWMKPVLLPMCWGFLPGGIKMCRGLLDNYGPHVEYIFNVTNQEGELKKSALEICEFLTHCRIEIEDPRPTTTQAADESDDKLPELESKQEEPADVAWHPAADVMRGIMTSSQADKEEGRQRAHVRKRRHAQKKENALRIVQLADFHVDEKYTEGAADTCKYLVCCRKDLYGTGTAGHWGGYRCNVPPRTIELFLNFTATTLNPDFLIYSGDNPPHSAWEETSESQIKVTQLAASLVEKNIFNRTNVTTYPAIGNHETMPTNLYTMNKAVHKEGMVEFNQKWEEAWATSAGFEDEQKQTIHKAGYYTMLVKEGLRIVCLNSNYGYMDNWYNLIHWVEDEYKDMMEWFETTLQKAKEADEKVIMVSHHDIGVNIIEFDKNFTDIMIAYKDIIVFHPVGHTHRDEYRLYFGEDTTQPAGMLHVSMTMGSWPHVNPGFRLFYLDREDYTVLDYDQYYLDLKNATEDAQPVKLYTFTEEYGLPDASADSHLKLWNKLRRDPDLMARYWETKRLRTGFESQCDETCVIEELCLQVSQTRKHFLTCVQYYGDEIINRTETTSTEPPTTEVLTSTEALNSTEPTNSTESSSIGPPTEAPTTTPGDAGGARGIASNPILVWLFCVVAVSWFKLKLYW